MTLSRMHTYKNQITYQHDSGVWEKTTKYLEETLKHRENMQTPSWPGFEVKSTKYYATVATLCLELLKTALTHYKHYLKQSSDSTKVEV